MSKAKSTLPVYSITSLQDERLVHDVIIADRVPHYLKAHPELFQGHGHSFYHIMLLTKGCFFHTIDFVQYQATPGSIYFMVPGQAHSWSFQEEVAGYVINFSESLFISFLADPLYIEHFSFFSGDARDQRISLDDATCGKAAAILEQVVEEVNDINSFQLDALRLQLLLLFILVERNHSVSVTPTDKAHPRILILQNFRRLLNTQYYEHKLPRDYASMLYVTPNYLNALCKELLGKPVGEVIRERVLLEAKRQLANLNENIAGIANKLGFTDNSYFSRFFKKYAGMTPEEFRRCVQSAPVKT